MTCTNFRPRLLPRRFSGCRLTVVSIPLNNLISWSPFENPIWNEFDYPLTREEVRQAIEDGDLEPAPMDLYRTDTKKGFRRQHAARVAWLVLNGWSDAIYIDVGIPSMGHVPDWPLEDGNHRLAASFYRGDQTINVSIGGDLDYAEELLGVEIPKNLKNGGLVCFQTSRPGNDCQPFHRQARIR